MKALFPNAISNKFLDIFFFLMGVKYLFTLWQFLSLRFFTRDPNP
jgi:hypothetical protein